MLIFFFAVDYGLQDQNWVMCYYKITLKELKDKTYMKLNEGSFLKEQGKNALLKLKIEENKYMRIPSCWFISEKG